MDFTYAHALDDFLVLIDQFDSWQSNLVGKEATETKEEKENNKLSFHSAMILTLMEKYGLDARETLLLGMKLHEDGMALFDPQNEDFRIMFKGRDFLKEFEGHGYVRKKEREIIEQATKVAADTRKETNAMDLTDRTADLARYTRRLVIATVLLVIVEILKDFIPFVADHWDKIFSFFCHCH